MKSKVKLPVVLDETRGAETGPIGLIIDEKRKKGLNEPTWA